MAMRRKGMTCMDCRDEQCRRGVSPWPPRQTRQGAGSQRALRELMPPRSSETRARRCYHSPHRRPYPLPRPLHHPHCRQSHRCPRAGAVGWSRRGAIEVVEKLQNGSMSTASGWSGSQGRKTSGLPAGREGADRGSETVRWRAVREKDDTQVKRIHCGYDSHKWCADALDRALSAEHRPAATPSEVDARCLVHVKGSPMRIHMHDIYGTWR